MRDTESDAVLEYKGEALAHFTFDLKELIGRHTVTSPLEPRDLVGVMVHYCRLILAQERQDADEALPAADTEG